MHSSYPLRHLSIRVPWHDAGWTGTVCQAPQLNGACAKLKAIANSKKDEKEIPVAGCSLEELPKENWPCCVEERAMFMAPFEIEIRKTHALAGIDPNIYGHFLPTPQRYPPYSAGVVPFFWLMHGNMENFSNLFELNVDQDREPALTYETTWIHEGHQAVPDGRDRSKNTSNCSRSHSSRWIFSWIRFALLEWPVRSLGQTGPGEAAQHNPPLSLTAPLPHIAIVSPLSCQKNALCAVPQWFLRPSIPLPTIRHGNAPFPSRPVSDVFRHFQADYPRPLTLSDTIGRKKSWSDAICLTSQVILTPKSSVIRTVPPFPTIIGRRRSCRQPHSLWGCENRPLPRLFEEIRCSKKVSLSFLFCSHTLI